MPTNLFRGSAVAAALALAACAAPVSAPAPSAAPVPGGAETITPQDMRARIGFLASDALQGRDTPSQGLEAAAAYLVSEYQRLGAEPAGEGGSYYQRYPFPLRRVSLQGTRLNIATPQGQQALRFGRDFFTTGGTAADLVAPLVFVSEEALAARGDAGVLRDKIAVFSLPGAWNRDFRIARRRQASLAQQQGAVAVLHVLDPSWTPESIATSAAAASQPSRTVGEAVAFPQFMIASEAADRIFGAAGLSLADARRGPADGAGAMLTLPGVTATAGVPQEALDSAFAPNVVAVIRGSDPTLRDEYVVLSAHMDHVGIGTPVNGDSIYNGADDDASGTAALLEVAEAIAALPVKPKRSVVFLHVSGEEKGLLGSEWYANHPTIPLDRTVANINVDMIARNSPDTVVVIGKDYSSLGTALNTVNARHPELGLVAADDQWPEEQFFFRSDHFNFARKEIPAIFFFAGVHEDYHRPSDEVERIDADKAARVARLIYHTTLEVANATGRPEWVPEGLETVRSMTR